VRTPSLLFLILLVSCKDSNFGNSNKLFQLLDSEETGIKFTNAVSDQEDFNVLTYRNYYNGGGVAIGDINNDGLQDIYFTANMGENKLYLNKGELKFDDISKKAGIVGKKSWTTGVTMADVNADGWLDIYVCYSGDSKKENKENELFINNGNLTFTEKAAEYGLNDPGLSTHASFFDMDLDGDLDCYVLNNSYNDPERISLYSRERFTPNALGGDRLYRNDGGKFVNITDESGIFSSEIDFGLGISVGDINQDLYPDIYISNDFWERDYLYINQKNGTFKEALTERFPYSSLSSMGSDIADINNDGRLDIFSTDMLPTSNERLKAATKFDDYYLWDIKFRNSYYYQFVQNCLQVNNGNGEFQETSFFSGLAATDWSWGALIFDMDLDGKKDIFVSNGVFHDITDNDFTDFLADKDQVKTVVEKNGRYDFRDFVKLLPPNKQKNYAFINQGDLKFENKNDDLGLGEQSFSNGSAYGDLDNDGDMDLVVNNVNMEAFVYKNNASTKNSFLSISFKGDSKNKLGIGSTVLAYANGEKQILHAMASRGFESNVDSRLIFGFGQSKKIDSLRIIWPDGMTQKIISPKVNSSLVFNYIDAKAKYNYNVDLQKEVFEKSEIDIGKHIENQYVDFDSDRLMPKALSTEGPNLVSGDINADGLQDYILQGAKGTEDQLYLGTNSGFSKNIQPEFSKTKNLEKTAGALFDNDKDGDLDYIVGMGGNEFKDGADAFNSYYFENDKGKFIHRTEKVPSFKGMISCIAPNDVDNDGDIDLFVGGRAVPGAYGIPPRSFMLRNNGPNGWEDISTEATGPLGMVTDAVWSDINSDNLKDLIVVGEWMPVTVILNTNGVPNERKPLPVSNGWWNCIKATDYDGDGDQDYLIGNWGQNFKLKSTTKKPIQAFIYDFDQNRRPDFILEWFTQDDEKPYPFASKQDLTAQLPFLKKTVLKYHDFAKKQVSDLFEKDMLEKATNYKVDIFSSSVLINDNGNLVLKDLPNEAQMSPIFTFETADFDKDGIQDMYVGGNFYRLKPEMGRLDGFSGGYFKGEGKGKYTFINAFNSGLNTKGETRRAKWLNNSLIIARNNEKVLRFTSKKNIIKTEK
jgi:enediyne biosynthesis protein E4